MGLFNSPLNPDTQVAPLLEAQEKDINAKIPPMLKGKAPKQSPTQLFKDYLDTGAQTFKEQAGEAMQGLQSFADKVREVPSSLFDKAFASEPKIVFGPTTVTSTFDNKPKVEPKKDAQGNIIPPMPFETGPIALKDRGVQITKQDIESLRPILFAEVSNRTPDKVELESRVLLNTALNRMKEYHARGIPMTLKEVLEQPNQYQGYKSNQYDVYKGNGSITDNKKKEQTDAIVDKMVQEMYDGQFADNIDGMVYYTHSPNGEIYAHPGKIFE